MKVKNRAISLLLSAALLCVPVSVLAEDIETNDLNMVNEVDASDASEGQRYQDYLSQFPDAAYPAVEVLAPAANAAVTISNSGPGAPPVKFCTMSRRASSPSH